MGWKLKWFHEVLVVHKLIGLFKVILKLAESRAWSLALRFACASENIKWPASGGIYMFRFSCVSSYIIK